MATRCRRPPPPHPTEHADFPHSAVQSDSSASPRSVLTPRLHRRPSEHSVLAVNAMLRDVRPSREFLSVLRKLCVPESPPEREPRAKCPKKPESQAVKALTTPIHQRGFLLGYFRRVPWPPAGARALTLNARRAAFREGSHLLHGDHGGIARGGGEQCAMRPAETHRLLLGFAAE